MRFKRFFLNLLHSRWLVPLTSAMFVLVFLLTLLAGLENARAMRSRIKEDFLKQQALLARQTSARFSEELETAKAEVRSLFRLTVASNANDLDLHLREAFVRLRGSGVIEIGVIDPAGTIRDEHEPGAKYTTIDMQALARGGENVRTIIMADPTHTSHLTICTYQPLPESAAPGQLPLTSFAHVDLERLARYILADVHGMTGSHAWIIDREGSYLYHPDSSLVGLNVLQVHTATDVHHSPCSFEDVLQKMKQGLPGHCEVTNGVLSRHAHPEKQLIAFAPLRTSGFDTDLFGSLAFETPTDHVVHGLETLYFRQSIAEGGLLAGLLLFGLLVASYQQRMSRNLRSLVGEQDRILSGILGNTVDAVVVIDENDCIQMWNRGAQLIFGYPPEEMLGQPLEALIPPDMDAEEEIRKINDEITKRGYVSNFTTQRITKDGRRITVDISRTPYTSPDGSLSGSTAVIKDMTEKVEFDQRMYNAEKLASLGLLASGVAHEINNPLTIVLVMSDLLKERFPEGSDTRHDLEMIEENANQALGIVQDLLNFSRVTERFEGSTDAIQMINKTVEFILHTKMNGDVTIDVELPDELPPIHADPRELQQVLLNLINNSLAAVDKAEGQIKIRCYLCKDQICIDIRDNGRGIPLDIQPRIFDPFFTTKDVGEGTGLGLSLCYGMVKKWGGEIHFESKPAEEAQLGEQGTTFTLLLPTNGGGEA